MDVRAIEAARARGHCVHSVAQEASHLPALVPPHHRAAVHLVLLHGVHLVREVVRGYELLCAQVSFL